jgi:hypothetical protein
MAKSDLEGVKRFMDTTDMVCVASIKDSKGEFYILKFYNPDEERLAENQLPPKKLRFSTSFIVNRTEYFVFKPKNKEVIRYT